MFYTPPDSGIRQPLLPSQFARHALVDEPVLAGLQRLLEGPIEALDDLERCEIGLRAILLHESTSPLHGAIPNPLRVVIEPFDPALEFSGDDPSIPEGLRQALNAALQMPQKYLSASNARSREEGTYRYLSDAERTSGIGGTIKLIEGRPATFPAPAMDIVVQAGLEQMLSATRLIAASVGGAGISWVLEHMKPRPSMTCFRLLTNGSTRFLRVTPQRPEPSLYCRHSSPWSLNAPGAGRHRQRHRIRARRTRTASKILSRGTMRAPPGEDARATDRTVGGDESAS